MIVKTFSPKRQGGFTLVELLVAMAITTVIVTILVSITVLALEAFNRNRSEIRAARQGRAMIESFCTDLESLVIRSENNFEWLYANSSPSNGGLNNNTYQSPNAIDFVFFSAVTDRYNGNAGGGGGDVSTLVYQLSYQDPIGGVSASSQDKEDFGTFALYRKIINPDDTFATTLGLQAPSLAASANPTPANYDLLSRARSAPSDPSISGDEVTDEGNFICENIYQFTLVFHVDVAVASGSGSTATIRNISVPIPITRSGNGGTEFIAITGSEIASDFVPDRNLGGSGTEISKEQIRAGKLSAIEVSLTVLSDFGVEQMRNKIMSPTQLSDLITANSYQYSKLVSVPGN